MAGANAERQRRYRARKAAHEAGDHALCDPRRCSEASGMQPVAPVTAVTRNTETRGQRLWREMSGDDLTGGRRVLLEEACRIADRLDRLDGLLVGDLEALLRFRLSDDGAEVTVTVNNVMSEARQQAAALKQIVAELRQGAGGDVEQSERGGSILDQLAAQRAKRLANASGS